MENSLNKIAWREAATGGLYLGLAYSALSIAGHLARNYPNAVSLTGTLNFFLIAGFLYFYAGRMAAYHRPDGFSFGQSMAFILRMSLFAGILAGLGMFVLYKWIDPETFQRQMDLAIATYVENGWDEKTVEAAGTLSAKLMHNPLFVVLGGIFSMLVYGGLLGLIVSFFVKRKGDPFAGADREGDARPLS